jgi:hypothetical protein
MLARLIALFVGVTTVGAESVPMVVSHVAVHSDAVADVSSLEAWRASFMTPGMSDQEKLVAIQRSIVAFVHHQQMAREYLQGPEGCVHDPIKAMNVYGYAHCCCTAAYAEALGRAIGIEARGWGTPGHCVAELKDSAGGHMLDPGFINYFIRSDGAIAGVEDLIGDIEAWRAKNPTVGSDLKELQAFMRSGGWKKGPPILATGPYSEHGWLPELGHGWYTTMTMYGNRAKAFVYEYGASLGYEVNNQLRVGERITFQWSNTGDYLDRDDGMTCEAVTAVPGKGSMTYSTSYGDLAPGRVGNGTIEYRVPLGDPAILATLSAVDNLAQGTVIAGRAGLHAADAQRPASFVVRMPSSFVYLAGSLDLDACIGSGGAITIAFSDNNGLDWKPVTTVTASGPQHVDLKPLCRRRYDYRLRFELSGGGTGVTAITIANTIQHSQRALPSLKQGDNAITLAVGKQEGTMAIEGGLTALCADKNKNVTVDAFHPKITNLDRKDALWASAATSTLTLPVTTPGDITAVRMACHYRARGAGDRWTMQASFDDGKTWKEVGIANGPTNGSSAYAVLTDVPAGARAALVRYDGKQGATLGLFDFAVHVDYRETNGGYRPVRITYRWDEDGQAKEDVHRCAQAGERWSIRCAGKPVMKTLVLELADR